MKRGEPITTYTGRDFYVLEPERKDIVDLDIAHALSLLCRGNGHYKYFYSVGQHCLNCLEEARARGYSARVQMACLMHDGSEAYISDITRPVKKLLPAYREIEHRLQNLIYEHYGVKALTEEELSRIAAVDDAVLYYEFALLHKMPAGPAPEKIADLDFTLRHAKDVEEAFLQALATLRSAL